MATIFEYPMSSNLAGVNGFSAMGISTNGTDTPQGIPGAFEVINGWLVASIRDTDPLSVGGIRAELGGPKEVVPSRRVYRWDWRIDATDWIGVPMEGTPFVVGQIHATPDSGTPAENMLMYCDGSRAWVTLPRSEPPIEQAFSDRHCGFSVTPGEINRMCLDVLWDKTGRGQITLYKNAVVLLNHTIRGTAYNHVQGPYLKLGIYQNNHVLVGWGARKTYVRNVRVTDGFDGKGFGEFLGDIPRNAPWDKI